MKSLSSLMASVYLPPCISRTQIKSCRMAMDENGMVFGGFWTNSLRIFSSNDESGKVINCLRAMGLGWAKEEKE